MMGVLTSALVVAFSLSMFSLMYNFDYINNVVRTFPKSIADISMTSMIIDGVTYVGFDTGRFIVKTEDYFSYYLDERYGSDSYDLSFHYYQDENYEGVKRIPTGVEVTFTTSAIPTINYERTMQFFVKRTSNE